MIGEWRCRNGWKAVVNGKFMHYWIGFVQIVDMHGELNEVPTYWDKDMNSPRGEWSLVEKRRGQEEF